MLQQNLILIGLCLMSLSSSAAISIADRALDNVDYKEVALDSYNGETKIRLSAKGEARVESGLLAKTRAKLSATKIAKANASL
ncbi:hypothetical protein [Halobacteriovorax sp.]|uniref:hypothetical protein n=1 Tax=Halobacteriovorax sp. TaxID=2020862 RepID=UPI003AF26FD7